MTLSTLIATLVGDTAEGVREASVAAARRRASLAESLDSEPTAADVEEALASLFPPLHDPPADLLSRVLGDRELDEYVSKWRPGRTAVRPGEVYLHPDLVDRPVAEFPPIERELGVSVVETVERGEGVARLTEKSVALVRRAVRERLETERRNARAAFADGVPTPVVESATVEAKAAFGGGEKHVEATLLDGREGIVRPELVGTVTADLRFVSLPAARDPRVDGGDDGTGEGPGAGGRPDDPRDPDLGVRLPRDAGRRSPSGRGAPSRFPRDVRGGPSRTEGEDPR